MHHALEAGLKNMKEWYQAMDNTSIYIISHGTNRISFHLVCLCSIQTLVLNPAQKLMYMSAAWEPKYVEMGMVHLRNIVSLIFFNFKANSDVVVPHLSCQIP